VPEVPVPYYRSERATIYCGDSFDLLRSFSDESVDALITDPPYSSGGAFRADRMMGTEAKYGWSTTKGKWAGFTGDTRDQRSYAYWSTLWLSECLRVAKIGSPICVFSDWRQLPTTTDAVQAAGWVWRGIAVWDKTEGARPHYGRFRPQCEYVVWGSKGPMPFNNGLPALPGLFRQAVRSADKFHIAGKPTEVMEGLVQIVRRDGLILDPFLGSGTTGVAALKRGYRFIGIERDESSCEVATRRLAEASR
jgi:site-specific DNA-methyltransferase (adenine-specific)